MFLKECKYIEKKVVRYITDDLKLFPHDSNENNFPLINAQKSLFPLSLSLFFHPLEEILLVTQIRVYKLKFSQEKF